MNNLINSLQNSPKSERGKKSRGGGKSKLALPPKASAQKHHIDQALTNQILIGKVQKLVIASFSPHGAYLIAPADLVNPHSRGKSHDSQTSNQPLVRVLLPNKFLPENASEGVKLEVFVMHDSDDRPVATTQAPKAQLGEIAALEVVSIEEKGCFLDLGLDKHIFMPSLYPRQFKKGQKVVVVISQDKQSRLLARLQVKSTLSPLRLESGGRFYGLKPHEIYALVSKALVFEQTPLGFGCAVRFEQIASESSSYYGLLYKSELSSLPKIGDELKVKIKTLRKDGKLDLALYQGNTEEIRAKILSSLPLGLNFSSPSEAIFTHFGISKKLFKRLINELVREGEIEFSPTQQCFIKHSSHTKE